MQSKTTYPRWFHSFRGFVFGLALGGAAMTLAYEASLISVGDLVWTRLIFPMAINAVPLLVLAPFEIYFGIRHYRALRRQMEGRTVAA